MKLEGPKSPYRLLLKPKKHSTGEQSSKRSPQETKKERKKIKLRSKITTNFGSISQKCAKVWILPLGKGFSIPFETTL
jgi:hypothetical protein